MEGFVGRFLGEQKRGNGGEFWLWSDPIRTTRMCYKAIISDPRAGHTCVSPRCTPRSVVSSSLSRFVHSVSREFLSSDHQRVRSWILVATMAPLTELWEEYPRLLRLTLMLCSWERCQAAKGRDAVCKIAHDRQ
jgi:hypothetical protein